MSIQEKLDSLRPYVVGIRYVEGIKVVEAKFEKNWSLMKNDNFKVVPDDNDQTYLYIMPQVEGVSIDDALDYVSKTIDYNIEQQKKHQLLKEKVEELKEVFKKYSYDDLLQMEFKIGSDDNDSGDVLVGTQQDLDTEEAVPPQEVKSDEKQKEPEKEEKKQENDSKKTQKQNGQSKKDKKSHSTNKVSEGEIELPPNGENSDKAEKEQ